MDGNHGKERAGTNGNVRILSLYTLYFGLYLFVN